MQILIQGFGIFEVCCIWQLFKKVFQIPFGVQVIGFGCFNQAVDDSTGFGSLGAVTKKPVFPPTVKGRMLFSAVLLEMSQYPSLR